MEKHWKIVRIVSHNNSDCVNSVLPKNNIIATIIIIIIPLIIVRIVFVAVMKIVFVKNGRTHKFYFNEQRE